MVELLRKYRNKIKKNNLDSYRVKVKTSDLFISTNGIYKKESCKFLLQARKKIENYIKKKPYFKLSMDPVLISSDMPGIVKEMVRKSKKCSVGPMAAVAGAVSDYVGVQLLKLSKEVIVENGGDVFIKLKQERISAVYAGDSPLSMKVGIKLFPRKEGYGLCTSSGTVGHSKSGGNADAVVCISGNTALADAAATRICNSVIDKKDIKKGLNLSKKIPGLDGCLIIMDDKMGAVGQIEICNLTQMK